MPTSNLLWERTFGGTERDWAHTFVAENVARQAPRLATDQTPQINGDADRVLVAW